MTVVSRDPFARTEIHRTIVPVSAKRECDWCGMPRLKRGKRVLRLFSYSEVSDSGKVSSWSGLFCCIDDARSYHQ